MHFAVQKKDMEMEMLTLVSNVVHTLGGTSMQLGMKRGMFEEAGNVMNAKLREFNTVKHDKNVLGMLRRNVM